MFGLGTRLEHAWFCSNECVRADAVDRLQRACGTSLPAPVHTTTVKDITDGASRIAAAAADAGDVTLRQARVDPFTWVRIAADGDVSTLVPPFSQDIEEHESWLAATTQH